MIAKAATISHGGNAIRYSVNKDRADIVKLNHLPEHLSAEAMYQRMALHQKVHAATINRGRPLKRNVIRMEVSPTKEESEGWSLDDWAKLADEFIRAFDSVDLSLLTQRAAARSTNVRNSQYVVALHHDARSGIPHLHIDVNRVDMDGHVNDDHLIAQRAMQAAHIINRRRGWQLPEDIFEHNCCRIAKACMAVLRSMKEFSWESYEAGLRAQGYDIRLQRDSQGNVRGYSVRIGNSTYKSSQLGTGRHFMPSRIRQTWAVLHKEQHTEQRPEPARPVGKSKTQPTLEESQRPEPAPRHYDISTDEYHHYAVNIPAEADDIIRRECDLPDDNPWATMEHVQRTALLLFAEYLDAATTVAATAGGGGSDMSGWGRNPEDDTLEWARRCARMARRLCQRRRGMHR